ARIVDFERSQRLRTVRSTNHEDAPVAEQRGGVSGAWRAHGVEGRERIRSGIEQLGGGDGETAIAGAARDQDRAVTESGGRVTPDRSRQRRREQRVAPRCGGGRLGPGERPGDGVAAGLAPWSGGGGVAAGRVGPPCAGGDVPVGGGGGAGSWGRGA